MAILARRALVVPVVIVAAIAGLTLWSVVGGNAPKAAKREDARTVQFNMAWLPQGSMAGIFVAIDKGYFADAGLNVEPVRGFGGMRTANELDPGDVRVRLPGPPVGRAQPIKGRRRAYDRRHQYAAPRPAPASSRSGMRSRALLTWLDYGSAPVSPRPFRP